MKIFPKFDNRPNTVALFSISIAAFISGAAIIGWLYYLSMFAGMRRSFVSISTLMALFALTTMAIISYFLAKVIGDRSDAAEEARIQAEKELIESEERFRATFEQAGVGIAHVALDGHWLRINRKLSEILGYSAEELMAMKFQDVTHPDDLGSCIEQTRKLLNGEIQNYSMEKRSIRKDGFLVWTNLTVSLVRGTQGEPKYFIAVIKNISERRKTEDALRNSETRLRASLMEKEMLLRELHHRVKNNLQIISSLLHLQSQSVRGKKISEMIRESQNRVRSMALIHEKLYQSEDLSHIDFGTYVHNLTAYLGRSYGINLDIIDFQTRIEGIAISVDTAIPCGLIINELVTNSLKYAFPNDRRGSIRISVTASHNMLTLVIADDGIGPPENFDLPVVETLGLQLVQTLVKQLEGNIELSRGKGTEFTVTIPISACNERNSAHGNQDENPDR